MHDRFHKETDLLVENMIFHIQNISLTFRF